MTEPLADGPQTAPLLPLRAFLRVGGIALARHQLTLALALGCERVICIGHRAEGDWLDLQHVAEAAGLRFHLVANLHAVLALITAQDEVVALADGLLAPIEPALGLLSGEPVVLVQPVEAGVARGFERLDLNHASAGAMLVPGRLLARMEQMPSDCDVFATLQRVALQGGVRRADMPEGVIRDAYWSLIRTEGEAQALENAWLSHQMGGMQDVPPAVWVAGQVVGALGPALLHAGTGGSVVATGAGLLGLVALAMGWFGMVTVPLVLAGLMWVAFQVAALFGRVERTALRLPRPRMAPMRSYAAITDALLLALLTWGQAPVGQVGGAVDAAGFIHRLFAAAMLLGLARLTPVLISGGWARWGADRLVLALVLALAALAGLLQPVLLLLALAMMATLIFMVGRASRLTTA
ncbi:hypothetical protein GTZ99_06045 [Novosphingobium sp. FSY-8]|uniref:Uncharacterized protein n=1 Tax=Novosphingobium ovatum TaxID=1908523 RepID=A0ABW9XC76_9SPHN|nr:hypothetical protein [Novosphingobium ovatum]NBC36118.1 hypothetical protein [Novosphingobium ovatum]